MYAGVRIQIYHADKKEGLPRHQHEYDHATFCTSGKCVVRHRGGEFFVDKNTQPINLLAPNWHEIEAVEDNTVFVNVFAEIATPIKG
jgi:quercetin dioxygenase-like cupin family protein